VEHALGGAPDSALGQDGAAAGVDGWQTGEQLRTVADLDAYIEHLDQRLQTVGDDAQLANIDLQNILQKQTQVLQTLSNVSKSLHDGAMAVIRKIGG
jgi:hypothetical protein